MKSFTNQDLFEKEAPNNDLVIEELKVEDSVSENSSYNGNKNNIISNGIVEEPNTVFERTRTLQTKNRPRKNMIYDARS